MTNSDSIFNSNQAAPAADQQQSAAQQVPDYLSGLVGEGRKYGSLEAAMKSIPNAQDHIARLEQENADLRAQAQAAEDLQAIIDKNLGGAEARRSDVSEAQPYNPNDLASLIDDRMNARSAQEKATANIMAVDSAMRSKFGDKATEQLALKAKELGVGIDFLQDTASRSPKAFLQLFGMSDRTEPVATSMSVQSSVNSEAMGNYSQPIRPGTKAYYDNLRKTNRSKYYDPRVQAQLSMDMVKPDFNT